MISVVLVTMLWIVHTNQRCQTTLPAVLEKKKIGRYPELRNSCCERLPEGARVTALTRHAAGD